MNAKNYLQLPAVTTLCTTSRLLMKPITRPELQIQCTGSVLLLHSDYESTVAGLSTLCIDAGFEQLNDAASSDGDDEICNVRNMCMYFYFFTCFQG